MEPVWNDDQELGQRLHQVPVDPEFLQRLRDLPATELVTNGDNSNEGSSVFVAVADDQRRIGPQTRFNVRWLAVAALVVISLTGSWIYFSCEVRQVVDNGLKGRASIDLETNQGQLPDAGARQDWIVNDQIHQSQRRILKLRLRLAAMEREQSKDEQTKVAGTLFDDVLDSVQRELMAEILVESADLAQRMGAGDLISAENRSMVLQQFPETKVAAGLLEKR